MVRLLLVGLLCVGVQFVCHGQATEYEAYEACDNADQDVVELPFHSGDLAFAASSLEYEMSQAEESKATFIANGGTVPTEYADSYTEALIIKGQCYGYSDFIDGEIPGLEEDVSDAWGLYWAEDYAGAVSAGEAITNECHDLVLPCWPLLYDCGQVEGVIVSWKDWFDGN